MSSNTFRIHIGDSAKIHLSSKYIDSLNETLSFFEDKTVVFLNQKPISAGGSTRQLGKPANLSNKLNIVALDFNSPEMQASGLGRKFAGFQLGDTKIDDPLIEPILRKEKLLDKLNPDATSQIFIDKLNLQRSSSAVKNFMGDAEHRLRKSIWYKAFVS